MVWGRSLTVLDVRQWAGVNTQQSVSVVVFTAWFIKKTSEMTNLLLE